MSETHELPPLERDALERWLPDRRLTGAHAHPCCQARYALPRLLRIAAAAEAVLARPYAAGGVEETEEIDALRAAVEGRDS